ncbi:hypothetical protein [Pseudomonas sp. S1_E04]
MKLKPSLPIIQGLLFTYCIENTKNPDREALIASINVNDQKELTLLFNALTKPEFIKYKRDEREWHINTLKYFLNTDENFDSVFYLFDTYFNDEIINKRYFMTTLLACLEKFNSEIIEN